MSLDFYKYVASVIGRSWEGSGIYLHKKVQSSCPLACIQNGTKAALCNANIQKKVKPKSSCVPQCGLTLSRTHLIAAVGLFFVTTALCSRVMSSRKQLTHYFIQFYVLFCGRKISLVLVTMLCSEVMCSMCTESITKVDRHSLQLQMRMCIQGKGNCFS